MAGTDYAAIPVATADAPTSANARPMTFMLNAAGVAAIQNWIDRPSDNSGLYLVPGFSFPLSAFFKEVVINKMAFEKLSYAGTYPLRISSVASPFSKLLRYP